MAVSVVMGCAQAFDRIGLPEGRFPLSQATLYLSATAKSNSTMALFDAIRSVAGEQAGEVPNHLKDGTRDKEGFGHGEGYRYPHAFRDHWVAQQYLPESLRGRVFWEPSDQGWEGERGPHVARQREAQLAAMVEGVGLASVERLTTGPTDARLERWLQRAAGRLGARLDALRTAVFEAAQPQRHELVLDVNARSGLFTWEALRRVPEGGVWSWIPEGSAEALRGMAERLPELSRPQVVEGSELLAGLGAVRVDLAIGRDVLVGSSDPVARLERVRETLLETGRVAFIETLVRHTPRLSSLVGAESCDEAVWVRWKEAEDALYTDAADPLTRWDPSSLAALFAPDAWQVRVSTVQTSHPLAVSEDVVSRWFAERAGSYADRLSRWMSTEALQVARSAVNRALRGRTVPWGSTAALLVADRMDA